MERSFKVSSKGLKGKHKTAFVMLGNDNGEKLELHLEAKSQLDDFQIEDEFTFKLTPSKQSRLTEA
jgi:hypothetical protein